MIESFRSDSIKGVASVGTVISLSGTICIVNAGPKTSAEPVSLSGEYIEMP
jgi:hypothetical protein